LGSKQDNVVVVDDHPSVRELVSTLLEEAGYRVREAATAREALALVEDEQPAVVLTDVVLPGMSGYELCRQLRDRYGTGLPIIFVSGTRTETLDSVAGLLIGADDYIAKPFDAGELLARVRRCVERGHAANGTGPNGGGSYGLTPRELEVLELLADGLGTSAIAERLVISKKTVATHVQRLLAKLGVHSRGAAVALAHREGLVADVNGHALLLTV
jgi:DNA-binding NarL/FixJ family response regulator